jgi:2-polyprenyl-3-methyl-5-hydroxy-6-metoxy-1,4-benzoquinol methylase
LGLDIDKKGIQFLLEKGYKVICADAQDFNLGEKFDVIVAGDIIEHLSDAGKFLECVKLHLKPEGILAISTSNVFWWKTWIHVALKGNSSPHPQHTCWFCEVTLTELLRRHGFQIDRVNYNTVYDLSTFYQKATKILNYILPIPNRFKHNTVMVVARIVDSI